MYFLDSSSYLITTWHILIDFERPHVMQILVTFRIFFRFLCTLLEKFKCEFKKKSYYAIGIKKINVKNIYEHVLESV